MRNFSELGIHLGIYGDGGGGGGAIRRYQDPEIHPVAADLGEWRILATDRERGFPREHLKRAFEVIGQWEKAFPREDNWINRAHGLPSPIIKLDATIVDGELKVYEVEDRPAGMGYSGLINPDLRRDFADVVFTWPDFRVVVSPQRLGNDDHLWAQRAEPDWDGLVLVRAEPSESDFHHLQRRSISTLLTEGNKSYGEKMGLWRKVTSPDEIDFDSGFVVKPQQGSKGQGVFVSLPKGYMKEHGIDAGKNGVATAGKIRGVIETSAVNGGVFIQPFYPPMETGISTHPWAVNRLFFGYDMQDRQWRYVGGTWNARNNLKIHGASDTLTGPLRLV